MITPAGFSLVEVTLAFGIVTTAILSTLGLLTIGLEMNRDSVARAEVASVAREVVADLRMLDDWSLESWPAGVPRNGFWPALASSSYEAVASLNPT